MIFNNSIRISDSRCEILKISTFLIINSEQNDNVIVVIVIKERNEIRKWSREIPP